MSNSAIFFSNKLDVLADRLYENLFSNGGPFEKRMVVVGHPLMKRYLQCYFARTKGICAGIKILSLHQLLNENVPSQFELALELQCYVEEPLNHELSRVFLKHGPQDAWQQELWNKIFKEHWTDPRKKLKTPSEEKIHLFGFEHLEEEYLKYFQGSYIYQLSVCSMFWGDVYSDKERRFLKLKEDAENPLLANLGRLGRKSLNLMQDLDFVFDEEYVPGERITLLGNIQQDLLELAFIPCSADSSVELHIATSQLHEIEILYENICKRQEADVLVLAPDISEYAPFIHMVFKDVSYAIFDEKIDAVKGLQQLLSLPKNDFEVTEVLKLFPNRYPKMAHIRRGTGNEIGSWEYGFKRLLTSLAIEEDEFKIESNELEELGVYIAKIRSLFIDLDLSPRSLNGWIEHLKYLLQKYFPLDEEGKAFSEKLSKLGVSLKHIGDKEFPFTSIEKIFGQAQISYQGGNVNAISFCNIDKAGTLPAKAIYLLGMKEGLFPRMETPSSLCKVPSIVADKDRYLFLQLITQASDSFIMSYAREENENPSFVVQELFTYPISKIEHVSLSQPLVRKTPFIPEFCMRVILPEGIKQKVIEIKKLSSFAKDPVKFYFNHVLKIYLDGEDEFEEGEFVVSNLTRYHLKNAARKNPAFFEKAYEEGKLPLGLFKEAAEFRFREEDLVLNETKTIEYHLDCDAPYEMRPDYLILPALTVEETKIVGVLEDVGLDADTLEEKLKVYPLLLIRDNSIEKLAKYIAYYEKGLVTPSPLMPKWGAALLQKGVAELERKIQPSDFGYVNPYLARLDVSAEAIYSNWSSYLRSVCADLIS